MFLVLLVNLSVCQSPCYSKSYEPICIKLSSDVFWTKEQPIEFLGMIRITMRMQDLYYDRITWISSKIL